MSVPRMLVPVGPSSAATPLKSSVVRHGAESAPLKQNAKFSPSTVALPRNLFSGVMLQRSSARQRRRPVDWIISVGIHLAVLGALLAMPLFFTQAIDFKQSTTTILVAAPAPPPPPPAASLPHASLGPRRSFFKVGELVAPTVVPRAMLPSGQDAPSHDVNVENVADGVPGGLPGGVSGGVLGGVLGGAAPAPPPNSVVPNRPKVPLRVGGSVKAPRLIYSTPPVYPRALVLQRARSNKKVCIDAVIDESGNVVQARAVCGDPFLIAPALEAVRKWRYEPTYLNGEPYPLELTVEVNFEFH